MRKALGTITCSVIAHGGPTFEDQSSHVSSLYLSALSCLGQAFGKLLDAFKHEHGSLSPAQSKTLAVMVRRIH